MLAVTLAHGFVAGRVVRPDGVASAGGASSSRRQAPEADLFERRGKIESERSRKGFLRDDETRDTHRTLVALPASHVRLALALTRHDVAGRAYRANRIAATP